MNYYDIKDVAISAFIDSSTDLGDCGSCWWWDELDECYDSLCGDIGGIHRIREVNKLNDYSPHYTHWLPHWAIKIPKEKDDTENF